MKLDREFLKKLWNGEKVLCPSCQGDILVPLHKNDKENFICTKCKKVFRTISIFNKMLKENQ